MLNDQLLGFSNTIWKDSVLVQNAGMIFKTPCRLHRPPFEVGLLVHSTRALLSGRFSLPVVRSIQYDARAVNMAIMCV